MLRRGDHQRLLDAQVTFLPAIGDELSAYTYKIGDKETSGVPLLRVGEELNRLGCVCAFGFRFEVQQLADDMQHMALALLDGDHFLDLVGEEDTTHLIVVLDG